MNRGACFRQIERKYTHKTRGVKSQNRFFLNICINRITCRSSVAKCKFAYFRKVKISADCFPVVIRFDELPGQKPDRLAFYRSETDKILSSNFGITGGVKRSSSGAPSVSSGFISISHSEEFLALLMCNVPCGIDIQVRNRELSRGKDWFYNEQERNVFGDEPSEDELYLIWCAKEAFYKMKQGLIDDLRSDVSITQIHPEQAILIYREKEYTIVLSGENRYCLAYCFEEVEK